MEEGADLKSLPLPLCIFLFIRKIYFALLLLSRTKYFSAPSRSPAVQAPFRTESRSLSRKNHESCLRHVCSTPKAFEADCRSL